MRITCKLYLSLFLRCFASLFGCFLVRLLLCLLAPLISRSCWTSFALLNQQTTEVHARINEEANQPTNQRINE
jgi:hypothetical protein